MLGVVQRKVLSWMAQRSRLIPDTTRCRPLLPVVGICLILSNEPRRSLWTETVAHRANACNMNDDAAHQVTRIETDDDNDVDDDAGDRGIVGSTWPFRR